MLKVPSLLKSRRGRAFARTRGGKGGLREYYAGAAEEARFPGALMERGREKRATQRSEYLRGVLKNQSSPSIGEKDKNPYDQRIEQSKLWSGILMRKEGA